VYTTLTSVTILTFCVCTPMQVCYRLPEVTK